MKTFISLSPLLSAAEPDCYVFSSDSPKTWHFRWLVTVGRLRLMPALVHKLPESLKKNHCQIHGCRVVSNDIQGANASHWDLGGVQLRMKALSKSSRWSSRTLEAQCMKT